MIRNYTLSRAIFSTFKQIVFSFVLTLPYQTNTLPESVHTYQHSKTKQLVTFIDDCHADYGDLKRTKEAQATIIAYAQHYKSAIVAEDLWHYEGQNPNVKKYLAPIIKAGGIWFPNSYLKIGKGPIEKHFCAAPQNGLIDLCKKLTIPCCNVECRTPKNASAGGYAITGKQAWEELRSTAEHIIDFCTTSDDPNALEYPSMMMDLFGQEKLIHALSFLNTPLQQHNACPQFIMFGNQLVEALMLRALYTFKDQPHIFYCVGGFHADAIKKRMAALGFEEIHSTPHSSIPEKEVFEFTPIDLKKYFMELDTIIKKSAEGSTATTAAKK